MSKLKKLVVTVGALAALAVGGAAFAQAQNASIPATAPTHQSTSEQASPGKQNDAPDSVAESDSPDGPNESADGPDRESQDD